jgi:peptide deformylase
MTKTEVKKIEIIQKDNPLLRKISTPVPLAKIKSPEIKAIISDMKKTIKNQTDAVAISAVQIAQPVRIFVVSKKVFKIIDNGLTKAQDIVADTKNDLVFINPKIVKTSKNKQELEEGCLSVRYVYGKVIRPEKASIEAYDENGKKFSRGFSGLFAQIVQHETDHLNGILFIDKAKDLQEISHEEYEKILADEAK